MLRVWAGRIGFAFMMVGLTLALRDIYRTPTVRLNRVTWGVLALLSAIMLLGYQASGAQETLWVARGGLLASVLLFLTTLVRGQTELRTIDLVCLALSLICIPVRMLASPQAALYLGLLIGCIALTPTFLKAYHRPASESRIGWTMGFMGSTVNLLAIGEPSLAVVSHPAYMFGQHVLMMYLLWWRPRRNSLS